MTRRAFTILETVMAAAIGMVVVLTAVAMMTAMTRADTTLARRAHQVTQLQVLHNVMSRAFTTLSMSETTPPKQAAGRVGGGTAGDAAAAAAASAEKAAAATRNEDALQSEGRAERAARPGLSTIAGSGGRSGAAAAAALAAGAGSGGGSGGASGDGSAAESGAESTAGSATSTPPPPRLVLAPDTRANQSPMTLRLTGDRGLEQAAPQQLEVVLAKPPVQLPKLSPPPGEAVVPTALDMERVITKSFRGIFELLPDTENAQRRDPDDPAPAPLALWWRPLPALSTPGSTAATAASLPDPPPPPVKIADQLAFCRWQVFQNSKSQDQYTAIWAQQLPAYVEMEVQTVGGLYAKWMFEVDWVVQAETELPAASGPGPTGAKVRRGAPGVVERPGASNRRPGSGRAAPASRGTPSRPARPVPGAER